MIKKTALLGCSLSLLFVAGCSGSGASSANSPGGNIPPAGTMGLPALEPCSEKLRFTGLKIAPVNRGGPELTVTRQPDGYYELPAGKKLSFWQTPVLASKRTEFNCRPNMTNPVVMNGWTLSFDTPVRYNGQVLPANTNLRTYQKFDGSFFNISASELAVDSMAEININNAFQVPPGEHTMSFAWKTQNGETLSATVPLRLTGN